MADHRDTNGGDSFHIHKVAANARNSDKH